MNSSAGDPAEGISTAPAAYRLDVGEQVPQAVQRHGQGAAVLLSSQEWRGWVPRRPCSGLVGEAGEVSGGASSGSRQEEGVRCPRPVLAPVWGWTGQGSLEGAPQAPQGGFWPSAVRRSICLSAASPLSLLIIRVNMRMSGRLPSGKINQKL